MTHDGKYLKLRCWWLLIPLQILFHSSLFSQETGTDSVFLQKVTLGRVRLTTYEALSRITDSTGLFFVYDSKIIPSDRRLRLNLKNVTLRDALTSIIPDTSIRFEPIGRHIVIFKPNAAPTDLPKISTDTTTTLLVRGRVIDAQSLKPIPYATVGVPELGMGNITNNEGHFALKLPKTSVQSTLLISHIGYRTQKFPVGVIAFNPIDIRLEVEYVSLQEVIIRNFDPNRIVRDFIESIPQNYSSSPQFITAFYREGIMKSDKLLNYSEGVFRVYKAPYSVATETDQAKLLKARKFINSSTADTINIKLKGGIASALLLDMAKNINSYFGPDLIDLYQFSRSDIVVYQNRNAFAIGFEQKPNILEPLLKGTLYIDIETLALVGAEFQINPLYVARVADQLVVKRNRRLQIRPERVAYSVTYKWINNKCYLAHARGDLQFRYRRRNQLFYGRFNAFLEMATSQVDTIEAKRFDRREVERISGIFADAPVEIDEHFWRHFNIVPPEANLYEALRGVNWNIELPNN